MAKIVNNIPKISRHLRNSLMIGGNILGLKGVADIQSNAPVGETGNLRRGYSFEVDFMYSELRITFGNHVPYAKYVEFKPRNKGGRPHFRITLKALEQEAQQIFERKLKDLEKI